MGTIKSLESIYGIDLILYAVALVKEKYPNYKIKVRIAGKGSRENEYKDLAVKLRIVEDVTWLGFITQEQAAYEWANMDLAVIPSYQESFGVSAVEAQASCVPVIISNIPGLLESTVVNQTCHCIQVGDINGIAKEIIFFYKNRDTKLGVNGRKYVEDNYEYNRCFKKDRKAIFRNIKQKLLNGDEYVILFFDILCYDFIFSWTK